MHRLLAVTLTYTRVPEVRERRQHRVISSMIGWDIHCHVHCHEEAERRLEIYLVSLFGTVTFLPLKLENVDSIVIVRVIHCHVHCHEKSERRLTRCLLAVTPSSPPPSENVDSISSAIYIVR